ncbi:MAG TPA: hypothetical protein VFM97_00215 [Gammaproteobacteria bacterium]|nr:hypothetical protein [Gammaproteobacteria bacterium]
MKPSLGRIVRFRLADSEPSVNGDAREFPAIIVRVWSDTCVNLKVFTDEGQDRWITSVPLHQDDVGKPYSCWFPVRSETL